MLMEDGRETLEELSEEVGLSTSGVKRRMGMLENRGIIRGYAAKVDPEKAGYGIGAFLKIDVRSSETRRVAGTLKQCKGVCEVHKTTGNHGLIAKVRAEDRGSISKFVEDEVSTCRGVKDVETRMTVETYKEGLLDVSKLLEEETAGF